MADVLSQLPEMQALLPGSASIRGSRAPCLISLAEADLKPHFYFSLCIVAAEWLLLQEYQRLPLPAVMAHPVTALLLHWPPKHNCHEWLSVKWEARLYFWQGESAGRVLRSSSGVLQPAAAAAPTALLQHTHLEPALPALALPCCWVLTPWFAGGRRKETSVKKVNNPF